MVVWEVVWEGVEEVAASVLQAGSAPALRSTRMSREVIPANAQAANEHPRRRSLNSPPTSAEPERAKSSSHSRREARRRERDGERSATAPAQ